MVDVVVDEVVEVVELTRLGYPTVSVGIQLLV